jgi:hypothetical protein
MRPKGGTRRGGDFGKIKVRERGTIDQHFDSSLVGCIRTKIVIPSKRDLAVT